ncbi:MAG: hypothetical protein NMNS01_23340 [Nitrosomonas sp.]|nr:MAG: hypothetical protein NMNS01_23340 [Nitrosomonas sp.]
MSHSKLDPNTPIPLTGKSRWARIAPHIPVSREVFRKLGDKGRAPLPIRLTLRCSVFDNAEIHRWLADPAKYRAKK